MSPYHHSADIAGISQTGQLRGLNAPALDPSADTYLWVKVARELFEVIKQSASSGNNRVLTGKLATMACQLSRALPRPQKRVLDNAQSQRQVNHKQHD
jgi:hypothetical protein